MQPEFGDSVNCHCNSNLYAYVGDDPVNNVDPDGSRCAALNAGSPYCVWSDTYREFDRLAGKKTRFFAAAAATVEYLANNDLPLLGNLISDQAESFLRNVSTSLYSLNAKAFTQIQAGSLSGANLDSRLVHMEQTTLQGMLDGLSATDRAAIVGSINSAMNSSVRGASNFLSQSDRQYNQVLNGVTKSLGRPIDFGRQSDREAIGNAAIKAARSAGECSQIETRIPMC